MKNKIIACVMLAIMLISNAALAAHAQETQDNTAYIHVFYGKGCPHCAALDSMLKDIEADFPKLVIRRYEVYFDDANRISFEDMAASYGASVQGVPTVFIDDRMIVGYSSSLGATIIGEIERCSHETCPDPARRITGSETMIIEGDKSPLEDSGRMQTKAALTLSAVVAAAAVDAINPCAFAVLIILLTSVLTAGTRRRALMAGLAFTASIYISYFLMGLGLYSAIAASGRTHMFFWIVSVLAILVGLFNLKDYFWYGRWFIMEVPQSWRPRLKGLLRGVSSVPGAFLIGFAVSLFLLPCTSGPYIVILGLLAKAATRPYALGLLAIYNLIFVLPMIIITAIICLGITTPEKAEGWRTRRLKALHLIAGAIILLLGLGMMIALSLGLI